MSSEITARSVVLDYMDLGFIQHFSVWFLMLYKTYKRDLNFLNFHCISKTNFYAYLILL